MWLSKTQKIFRIIIISILCLLLLVNAYVIVVRIAFNNDLPELFGYSEVIVISGSMIPTLQIGDILIIQGQESYQVNDIVTYRGETKLITHRIVAIENNSFVTKGDFNNTNDDPIPSSALKGKVVARIHGIGKIVFFLRTPFGVLTTLVGLFILIELPNMINQFKRVRK